MSELPIYGAAVVGVGKTVNSHGTKGGGHQIGYTHAGIYQDHPRINRLYGVDINEENLHAFGDAFSISPEDRYTSLESLLSAPEGPPEIVSLCTYVGLRHDMIKACAEAGVKLLLCEKPFVANLKQLHSVREIAARTGVKISVAHIRRYRPVMKKAQELVRAKAIGEPMFMCCGIGGWDISEMGSHWLDLFRMLMDDQPIRWVMGQGRVRDFIGYGHRMEEHAIIHWEFQNGCRGLLDGGTALGPKDAEGNLMEGGPHILISGTEGSLRIYGENRLSLDAFGKREEHDFSPSEASGGDYWNSIWHDWLNDLVGWVDGGPEPVLGLSNVWKSAELNLCGYISMIRGDRVDLPAEDLDDTAFHQWPLDVVWEKQGRANI